ncbi:MAG: hypothetical protein HY304_02140 [candidate division Zixibacteria bacterium]|nr:hypothetical protein [candidate division Zixibacteria bacterium]
MKPSIRSRLARTLGGAAIAGPLRVVLALLSILLLFSLLPISVTFAQGCGGMSGHGGGHSGSHDQTPAQPTVTLVWTNIIHNHSGLHRAVIAKSVPDAVFYGGLLRDDFKLLKTNARSMYQGMEGSLESANNRVKQLTKQIPKDLKADDQSTAAAALRHLDIEMQRVVALFPPGALPGDVVSTFQAPDSLDVGDEAAAAESAPTPAAAPVAKYTCPMHPEVNAARPGNCPKCGMALVKE